MNLHLDGIMAALAGGGLAAGAGQSFILLALVALGMAGWRRGAAAARHLAWFVSLLGLLCLPWLGRLAPVWSAPDWMAPAELLNRLPDSLSFLMQKAARPPASLSAVPSGGAAGVPNSARTTASKPPEKFPAIAWGGGVVALWLAGLTLGGAWFLAARLRLHRLAGQIPDCQDAGWREQVEQLRRDYHIQRPVRLRVAAGPVSPVTWGFLKPVVVLPAEARAWPAERLALVLRHELAHIRRWDCLTQELAQVVCLIYWFNPLAWLAAGQMRAERERACDDFVLGGGAKPSEYAGHLVAIARQFAAAASPGGAVAMARPSGLEQRVTAILDGRRNRRRISPAALAGMVVAVLGLGILIGGCSKAARESSPGGWSLNNSLVAGQWKQFVAEKTRQEAILVEADGIYWNKESVNVQRPACQPFFNAAAKGDWQTAAKLFSEFASRVGGNPAHLKSPLPHGMWWAPVNETYGAMEQLANGDEKYEVAFGRDIINSIPPGSIYFGGTDPGRFLVTALSESQVDGKPFFTLTQNALADGAYLEYLRAMYGGKIKIPSQKDSNRCFQDFMEDIQRRQKANQLKPGEDIKNDNGHVAISGRVAVMEINALLAKTIFDNNPDREFYLEESWPLDWMYPNLEPHGLIFKINRQPLAALSTDQVQSDHDYWTKYVTPMIGNWLDDETPVKAVTDFATKVFHDHDFTGFQGDPGFVQNKYSSESFAKLRSAIAGLYVWRMDPARDEAERERMARAADFAFRQALALSPTKTDTTQGYVAFLKARNRGADAELVPQCAAQFGRGQ